MKDKRKPVVKNDRYLISGMLGYWEDFKFWFPAVCKDAIGFIVFWILMALVMFCILCFILTVLNFILPLNKDHLDGYWPIIYGADAILVCSYVLSILARLPAAFKKRALKRKNEFERREKNRAFRASELAAKTAEHKENLP